MAVPRNRLSNARKRIRRAHDAKKPLSLKVCDECDHPILPHRACIKCGTYKGSVIEGIAKKQS